MARTIYETQDRYEILYAMKNNTNLNEKGKLKVMDRYKKDNPRVVQKFKFRDKTTSIHVEGDTDRKGTNGGAVFHGGHAVTGPFGSAACGYATCGKPLARNAVYPTCYRCRGTFCGLPCRRDHRCRDPDHKGGGEARRGRGGRSE
jgi:hypothetical protein